MFEYLGDLVNAEILQSADEGVCGEAYARAAEAVAALKPGVMREQMAGAFLDGMYERCLDADSGREPTDYSGIIALLPDAPEKKPHGLSEGAMLDRLLGAWQGRAAGCLLGKPFEGRWQDEIYAYFGIQPGAYAPLSYFTARDGEPNPELRRVAPLSVEKLSSMPEDDDTNYTVLALTMVEKYGRDFTSAQWAEHFVSSLPHEATFTAERVAYRNLLDLYAPPASAVRRNPYREWIGAQIRADLYGYINPGDPMEAARMAHTDARVTHIKNGVYGAMFSAASIAAAFTMPAEQAVRVGMRVLPPESRLRRALEKAAADFDAGGSFENAMARLREAWNEKNRHHWCHTVSNAVIVLNAILYGGEDMDKTLSMAVLPGFDTDCNGATAGSILGASLGEKRIPAHWLAPMSGGLTVSLIGAESQSFDKLARRTAALIP